MKNILFKSLFISSFALFGCNSSEVKVSESSSSEETKTESQTVIKDDISAKNVVQIAVGSKDHTTLVTAVTTAELADDLSTTGPFTVFAPTNAAFDKLPAGTVSDLLKPENREKLATILQYHVYVGTLTAAILQDGQSLGMVDGGNIKITKKDGKIFINDNAEIIASIPASNGIIHVVNTVLLPK